MNKCPEIQFKSPMEIKLFQEARLKEELEYLKTKSKYYSRIFNQNNIDISQIQTLEDLSKLPVTTKKELQVYNEEFLCVDKREIVDYVTTSGTLGDPVLFALTNADLDRLAYNEYLSFTTAGCVSDDVIQLMTTIDRRFMAGLAYFLGARELGAGT